MEVIFFTYSCICSGLRSNMNLEKKKKKKKTYAGFIILKTVGKVNLRVSDAPRQRASAQQRSRDHEVPA